MQKLFVVLVLLVSGCTIRLGGPKPVEYRTVGWEIPAGVAAADAAAVLRSGRAELALLVSPADSSWFSAVADAAGQTLSGPAPLGDVMVAFIGAEPLGDTTVALQVEGGGAIVVHDALYRVDRYRYLDLMALRLEPGADIRETVRALLRYMATDVMVEAAVVLAVSVPTTAVGDSVANLLRPHLTDAHACDPALRADGAQVSGLARVRLFFGPEAKAYCAGTELLSQPNAPVLLRFVVER